MQSLDKPKQTLERIVEQCADSIQDDDIAGRLRSVIGVFKADEAVYDENGRHKTLCAIPASTTVGGVLTKKEMETVYKGTFSRKGSSVRHEYDAIKNAPIHKKCPLCGISTVAQLDHYLPKTDHPAYAITPINLIPSCGYCNHAKGIDAPSLPEKQYFHPYYDNFDDDIWLNAIVTEGVSPVIQYVANPPEALGDIDCQRIKYHFDELDLGERYTSFASEEMANIKEMIEVSGLDNPVLLKAHLSEIALARTRASKNTWHAAMYRALSESDWFCEEGYKLID